MKFLKKIQTLPELKRKTLFWAILILVGISAFLFWFYRVSYILKKLGDERIFEDIETPEMEGLDVDGLKQNWRELDEAKSALEKAVQDETLPQGQDQDINVE